MITRLLAVLVLRLPAIAGAEDIVVLDPRRSSVRSSARLSTLWPARSWSGPGGGSLRPLLGRTSLDLRLPAGVRSVRPTATASDYGYGYDYLNRRYDDRRYDNTDPD